MASNIPKEYQKSYTWDAIVFTDGATCVRIESNRTNERRTPPSARVGLRVSRATPNEGARGDARAVSAPRERANGWMKMMTDGARRVFPPATQVRGLGERARAV